MKPETGGVDEISRIHSSELKIRVRTGAVLTVIGIIVLCFSHIRYVMNTVAASLSSRSFRRLCGTVRSPDFSAGSMRWG